MSWLNEEVDQLFRDLDDQQTFTYRESYFQDVASFLPLKQHSRTGWLAISMLTFFILFPASISKMLVESRSYIKKSTSAQVNAHSPSQQITLKAESHNSKEFRHIPFESSQMEGFESDHTEKKVLTSDTNGIHSTMVLITASPVFLSTKDLLYNKERNVLNDSLEMSHFSTRKTLKGFVRAYASLGQAWTQSDVGSVYASTGMQAGVSRQMGMCRLHIGLGIEYTRFSGLTIMERTKIYGLSSQILENSYAFHGMFSASVPFHLDFSKGRHQFGAGLTTKVNVLSSVHHRKTLDGNSISYSTGYTGVQLFRHIQLQPEIRYSYSVKENLSIGVQASVSLLSPIRSDRLEGVYNPNPISVEFSVHQDIQWK
jgi:hypothetical protein